MFNPESITSVTAAFGAGLLTSLHCVGMCGPLACAFCPKADEPAETHTLTTTYHCARLLAYTLIGLIAGSLGQGAVDYVQATPAQYLPWILVLFFLVLAFGLEQKLPKPKFMSRAVFRLTAKMRSLPRVVNAGVLGLATPFLPCGPLYLIFGLALVMGSPVRGAEFTLAFGLGTLPLLYVVHSQYVRWRTKLSPVWMVRIQRGLAFSMALIMALRLRGTLGFGGPEVGCPFCP